MVAGEIGGRDNWPADGRQRDRSKNGFEMNMKGFLPNPEENPTERHATKPAQNPTEKRRYTRHRYSSEIEIWRGDEYACEDCHFQEVARFSSKSLPRNPRMQSRRDFSQEFPGLPRYDDASVRKSCCVSERNSQRELPDPWIVGRGDLSQLRRRYRR
jgi:hypothetical protein